MKVYLAAPMRGYPDDNHPAMFAAAAWLRECGLEVSNPAEFEAEVPYVSDVPGENRMGAPLPNAIARRDFGELVQCQGIVLLPGWELSSGVAQELWVAEACGLEAYLYVGPDEGFYEFEWGDERTFDELRDQKFNVHVDKSTLMEIQESLNKNNTPVDYLSVTGVELDPATWQPAPQGGEFVPPNCDLERELVRTFDTGATRNSDNGKYDFEGFLSPSVLVAFGEYMNRHRYQADGSLRSSDNWQKGIPLDAYIKSLLRHVIDLWLIHRGQEAVRPEDGSHVDIDEALAAILFNVQGYWHETLKAREVEAA